MLLVITNGHHSIMHLVMAIINASSSSLIDMPTSMLLVSTTPHHSIMYLAMAIIDASSS